jgi:hypothetical protein
MLGRRGVRVPQGSPLPPLLTSRLWHQTCSLWMGRLPTDHRSPLPSPSHMPPYVYVSCCMCGCADTGGQSRRVRAHCRAAELKVRLVALHILQVVRACDDVRARRPPSRAGSSGTEHLAILLVVYICMCSLDVLRQWGKVPDGKGAGVDSRHKTACIRVLFRAAGPTIPHSCCNPLNPRSTPEKCPERRSVGSISTVQVSCEV